MSLHRLFLFALAVSPLSLYAACSASNGDAIPNEARDAGELDSGGELLPDGAPKPKDGGNTEDDSGNPKKDSGAQDAASDSPATNPIVINEIYVSNNGQGDNSEYVELRGTPGTSLADLKLRLIDSTGQVKYEVNAGDANDVFPVDGLWSIGGSLLFDQPINLSSWGLDNTRGAVQLVRGANKDLLDVVGYAKTADAGALPQPSSPPLATVEGKPALIPTIGGRSFGRKTAAQDTNDNEADFCSMPKSDGTAQKDCDP